MINLSYEMSNSLLDTDSSSSNAGLQCTFLAAKSTLRAFALTNLQFRLLARSDSSAQLNGKSPHAAEARSGVYALVRLGDMTETE